MSSQNSTTGNVLGAIGAVVGGIFGGPVGAAQGYAIGSSVGNAIDPPKGPTQEGPRLQDKSVQTSTYGATIPRIYGTCKVAGNIFWLEKDQLKEKVKKESSGGKGGGGGTEVKTYTYYATFAVGICRGPIQAVRRIWIGPNLIYDAASDDLETIIASNQNVKNIEIYLGGEDQQPNSRMQADKGAANTPAYNGLAYLVIKDFELTKYGNSLAQAQVSVEVVNNPAISADRVFDASAMQPNSGSWFSAIPGGTSDEALFGNLSGADRRIYVMSKNGRLSFDLNLATNLSGFSPSQYIRSVDSTKSWFFSSSTDTENLLMYDGQLKPYITTNKFVNHQIIERGGNVFFRWTNDLNNPGTSSAGFHYTASVSFDSFGIATLGSVAQTLTDCAIAVDESGRLLHSSFGTVPTGSSGTCNFTGYTSAMAVAYSGTFTIPARVGVIDDAFSAAYVVGDTCHIVCSLSGAGVSAGSIYYFSFSISSAELIFAAPVVLSGISSIASLEPKICRADDGLLYISGVDDSGDKLWRAAISVASVQPQSVPIASVVESESLLSGLISAPDLNASALSDNVYGYRVASTGSIRNSIEPLRGAWPFDVLQDGYQIKFQPRGSSSIATIDIGELGVNEQIREAREMDSQIARKVVVKYLDQARDYDINEQFEQRENTDAVNTLTLDMPVVLSATEAKRVAQKLLYLYWLDRSDFSFKLPPEYHYLQPSDVITVNGEGVQYELLIRRIVYNQDGSLDCTAKPNAASIYTSIADADGGLVPPVTIPLPGESIGLLLDIPVVDETLQNTSGYVGYMTGETSGWPGGVYWITNDDGQTWTDLQGFIGKGTFGTARGTLSANSGLLIQLGGSLTVDLYSGTLEGITQAQMLNGKNYAAYGAAGRWEIIRFQNATLNADGSYTLSGFIRGDRGTEWATGLHQAGDMFCLLDDPDGAFIFTNTASIGVPRTLRAVTAGADIDSAANESFTYNGVNLECYSPVHAKGSRDGSSNLAISWIRRTRIGGEWRSNVDASLGETTEAYEIDVMDGATVKRTINSATQSATYTAADQTTDFGAPQSSVTVRIYQMSATVGRGYPLEVTL